LGYTAKLHDFSQRPPQIMVLIVAVRLSEFILAAIFGGEEMD